MTRPTIDLALETQLAASLTPPAPFVHTSRPAKVFVTGGTGFFGCWLLETLLWASDRLALGASATVLTRSPGRFHRKAPHLAGHAAVSVLEGDVRTFAFPSDQFSHVIHAATDSSGFTGSDAELFDTIVGGTELYDNARGSLVVTTTSLKPRREVLVFRLTG